MLLNEIITAINPIKQAELRRLARKYDTKKVQPVSRTVKTENEPDVRKKQPLKGRIDTYA